ncbi:MAG: hypothetical protein NVSMB31_07110 [Vulcanimicrobiaceae bacterium]
MLSENRKRGTATFGALLLVVGIVDFALLLSEFRIWKLVLGIVLLGYGSLFLRRARTSKTV